jgi:hypothetical protein
MRLFRNWDKATGSQFNDVKTIYPRVGVFVPNAGKKVRHIHSE